MDKLETKENTILGKTKDDILRKKKKAKYLRRLLDGDFNKGLHITVTYSPEPKSDEI